MATRQYIGARYVPLYIGDWDSTKNYEPLSIVTDANGNSFTSLKDVPAGTPLTDRNYWIQTSSFSGAVDQLQRRVNDLDTRQGTTEGKVSTLETDVNDLKEKEEISSAELFVMIGDSFGSRQEGWINALKDKNNLTEDITCFTNAVGGAGFINGVSFIQQAMQINQRMTAKQKKSVKKVVTVGGVNDYLNSDSDIFNAVKEYCGRINELFPNAIHYVAFNFTFASPFIQLNVDNKPKQYSMRRSVQIGVLDSKKSVFITGFDSIFENRLFVDMSDGVHPNANGAKYSGEFLQNAINSVTLAGAIKTSAHNSTLGEMTFIFNGEYVQIELRGDIYNGAVLNPTAKRYNVIYTQDRTLPFYPSVNDIFIYCPSIVLVGDSQIETFGVFRIRKNGDVELWLNDVVTNVTRINVTGNVREVFDVNMT